MEQVFYNNNTHEEKSLVVQQGASLEPFKVGQVDKVQLERLIEVINIDDDDPDYNPSLVEWQAVPWLQNIIRRNQSCIITGDDGSGKSIALSLAADLLEDPDIHCISSYGNRTTSEVYFDLWRLLDMPLPASAHDPTVSYSWRERTDPSTRVYKCLYCHRHCMLDGDPPPAPELNLHLAISTEVKDKCKLVIDMVHQHLPKLKGSIVLRVPGLDADLIKLLRGLLLEEKPVVILCNNEQANQLRKLELFSRLPPKHFLRPPAEFFLNLAVSMLNQAEMDTTPLDFDALWALIMMSRQNPGRFRTLLAQLFEVLLLADEPETLDAEFVCQTIAYDWDDSEMIRFAINKYRGQRMTAANCCALIRETLHKTVSEIKTGRELAKQFKRGRTKKGTTYLIPEKID